MNCPANGPYKGVSRAYNAFLTFVAQLCSVSSCSAPCTTITSRGASTKWLMYCHLQPDLLRLQEQTLTSELYSKHQEQTEVAKLQAKGSRSPQLRRNGPLGQNQNQKQRQQMMSRDTGLLQAVYLSPAVWDSVRNAPLKSQGPGRRTKKRTQPRL